MKFSEFAEYGKGKLSEFGKGEPGPGPDDIEEEAEAELRRAIGGAGQPRTNYSGYGRQQPDWNAGRDDPDDDYEYEYEEPPRRRTADDERRMATDLAMQQFSDRPQGRNRPGDSGAAYVPSGDPEDLRNRALAAAIERQKRMQAKKAPGAVQDQTPPRPAQGTAQPAKPVPAEAQSAQPQKVQPPTERPKSIDVHGMQSRKQRASGANISPSLSARPTLTGARPLPDDVVSLASPTPQVGSPGYPARPKQTAKPGLIAKARAAGGLAGALRARAEGAAGGGAPAAPPGRSGPSTGGPPRSPASGRGVPPVAPPSSPPDLDELDQILSSGGNSLPVAARWLSDEVDASAALVLSSGAVLDDFVAWPKNCAIARELKEAVDEPLDHASTIWKAMNEKISASSQDGTLVMPDGVEAEGCEWLVVPFGWDSKPLGVAFLTRSEGEPFSDATIQLVEDAADLIAETIGRELAEPKPSMPREETPPETEPPTDEAAEQPQAPAEEQTVEARADKEVRKEPAAAVAEEPAAVAEEPAAVAEEPAAAVAEEPAPAVPAEEPAEAEAPAVRRRPRRRTGTTAMVPAPAVAEEPAPAVAVGEER